MARLAWIAWVLLAASFSMPARATLGSPQGGSVEAAAFAPAIVAPSQLVAPSDGLSVHARLAAATSDGTVATWRSLRPVPLEAIADRRAMHRRAIHCRAPPRLPADGPC